ncbi:glycosyltransferase family 2 protein [bacterium]|nr:glycosyltransferase family 2 protein [bacterium]
MKYTIDAHKLPKLEEVDLSGVDLSGGISVFLPAYNEEGNIERAVKSSVEMLKSITDNYEVLVVNDASTDRTRRIVEELIKQNSHIRIYNHEKNTRLGGAMRSGFYLTTKDYIFYCDADNPVDMWDVKRALPLMAEYDLIAGFRFNRDERFIRKIYSKVYNTIVRNLFNVRARDINFSFKLVKRTVLDEIELRCRGGFLDGELIIEALRRGFNVAQVGVRYIPRTAGVSTMASPAVIIEIMKEMWAFYRRIQKSHRERR